MLAEPGDGELIHHKSGITDVGRTFENSVFIEGETGNLTLRMEEINGTNYFLKSLFMFHLNFLLKL